MTRMRRGDREADPGEEDDRTGRERGLRVLDALTGSFEPRGGWCGGRAHGPDGRSASCDPAERALRMVYELTRAARGSGSGVSSGSTSARRCSKAGGSERRSPRWSRGSSVAKPGPIVAISKRTPLGSRK